MNPDRPLLILAAVPEGGDYVNLYKVAAVVVILLLWAASAQWVDRDTDVVKTKREQWNVIILSTGLVAFVALLIPPWSGGWFFAGLVCFLGLAGGALAAYVVHRNGRVVPTARVLTPDHFKRLLAPSGKKKKGVVDRGQRVRIVDHSGSSVQLPDDPQEAEDYQTVQDVLFDLLWRRASDVDLLSGKERFRLVHRIDGVATERAEGLPPDEGERTIRYLKKLAGLNVEEIRRPQVGRIQASLLSHNGDVGFTEVHTSGTTAGERLRLRIQSGPVVMRLPELGLAQQRLEALQALLTKPHGLLLLSALPHNGLTTTQYAVVRNHDAYMQNIHSVERRILTDLDNITQRVYEGNNSDVNYARLLQSVLRREPDVVLVGECEDRETAQIAARAAVDERKIYLGIHGKDCFDALGKYLTFVDDNKLAAKGLLGVLNERLVRVLCTACREAFRPDAATLKKLNLPADKIDRFYRPPSEPVLDKKGDPVICPTCQGAGYVGRTGLFELLVVDDEIAKLIAEGAAINKIKTQCRKNRMYYLQEEGLLKVIAGTTSLNEVLRCLRNEGE